MNRSDHEIRITPSVLDRLIDEDPGLSSEAPASRQRSLAQLKDAVKRDLEWLLNTRQTIGGIPPGLQELTRSVAAYGLPDFTTVSLKSPSDQSRMQRTLETAIKAFEPRLDDVKVTITTVRSTDQKMRFHIEARLKVEPAPEPVSFDTVLQVANSQYVVKAE